MHPFWCTSSEVLSLRYQLVIWMEDQILSFSVFSFENKSAEEGHALNSIFLTDYVPDLINGVIDRK